MSNTAVSAALSGCSLTYTRFLRDTPAPGGEKQRVAGAGGRALGPVAPPLNTYEVLGTRGCGCNRRAVGFDRSAPAHRSPRGWLLPARDGGLATGLERGRGPGLGPAQHQDLDRDQLSPRMRTGAGTWIGTSSALRSRLGPAEPQDEDEGSALVLGPGLGPAQHRDLDWVCLIPRMRMGAQLHYITGTRTGTGSALGPREAQDRGPGPGGYSDTGLGPGLAPGAWEQDPDWD